MNRALVHLRSIARLGVFVSTATLALAFPIAAIAADPAYCVRSVDVVAANTTADLERQLHSLEPLPKAPDNFKLSKGAWYPLAYRSHTVEGPRNHDLYWSFSDKFELVGPHDFFNAEYPVAVGRDGRSFLLGSTYQKIDSGKLSFRQLLLQQVDGGVIAEIRPDLQKQLKDIDRIAWSDMLDGFVLSSRQNRAGSNGADDMTLVLRGDALAKLPDEGLSLRTVTDVPSLGATALLGYSSLAIVTPQLEMEQVAALSRGHYGRFEALYETRDRGWLYADGDDFDNAVHVEQVDGKWRATDIVRIEPIAKDRDEGWLERFFRWYLGPTPERRQHDEHFRIVQAETCRRFSTAAKRMFFCAPDSKLTTNLRHELRAGKIVPIAGGTTDLRAFLGDADGLGLALFLGADYGLYGYDGERLHRIADADFDNAVVYDLTKLGRTLLVSPDALFEVRAKGDGYELVKLAGLGSRGLFGAPFVAAPDGKAVLAFASHGVYQLKDDALTLIWPSKNLGAIHSYGGTPPTEVAGWGGILFTTYFGKELQELRFHLLRPCSEATGDAHPK